MKVAMKIRRSGMFLLALAMVLFLTPTGSAAEENVISEARNGVVRIFAYDPESGSGASGSGFGVGTAGEETEYFVTNWHVVTANGQYPVGKLDVYILLTNDAITMNAEGNTFDPSEMIRCQVIYAADQYPDVAILKAERKVPGRVALTLRSSRDVAIASKVYSLGYPAAADGTSLSQEQQTAYYYADVESVHVNGGVVSKLSSFELFNGTYCLEHDAHINSGNSGGPLVDEHGNVVGINTYGISSDDFLNYSVYIDYAMDYLNQLGIAYDYVSAQESFPMAAVASGAALVLVLAAVLVLKIKKSEKQPAKDTGLRVQYSSDSIMGGKRYVINSTLRFGRAADCNIRYQDKAPGISSHHCEITVEKGQAYMHKFAISIRNYIFAESSLC